MSNLAVKDMEVYSGEQSNGDTPRAGEGTIFLNPVSPGSSGVGLPYAPENWPNPGDNWRWKVGKRINNRGQFIDRYLCIPTQLRYKEIPLSTGYTLKSKRQLEGFIKRAFPGADFNALYSSFSWKIPAKEHSFSHGCKVGNEMCCSPKEDENMLVAALPCDLCCKFPQFCRQCCCTICSVSVNSLGDYSLIKCEASVREGYICGHAAHISCALRAYLTGATGEGTSSEAAYYCYRCDAKIDLFKHVEKLLEKCEFIISRDEIEETLKPSLCVLRGSENENAKVLLKDIELAIISKIEGRNIVENDRKGENYCLALPADESMHEIELVVQERVDYSNVGKEQMNILRISSDYTAECHKVEAETDQALQGLRETLETYFKIAENRLNAQKTRVKSLYQQLEKDQSELVRRKSANSNVIPSAMLNRVDELKVEVEKLRNTEEAIKNLGQSSIDTLRKHFNLNPRY